MKIIGLIFVLVSFSSFGFYLAEKEISKLMGIERAKIFLENMIIGISDEKLTVAEIFESIKKTGDKITVKFIRNLTPDDFLCISEKAGETGFCSFLPANAVLDEAFRVFGRYSAKQQTEKLISCKERMAELFKNNERNFQEKAKLLRCCGFLLGAFVVIMLI